MRRNTMTMMLGLLGVATLALLPLSAQADGQNDVEQTLIALENDVASSVAKADIARLQELLASTYTLTDPLGAVMSRDQVLAQLTSGDLKFESSTYDDIKVQVYGDTAVVTLRSTDKGTYKDMDISGQYRWTDTLIKLDGRWQIVATHGCLIPPAQQ